MAMRDWNMDGENDRIDDFMEFEMLEEDMDSSGGGYSGSGGSYSSGSHYSSGTSTGLSGFGITISIIAGLFLSCFFYMFLGIDVDDVPAFLILIIWGVFSFIVAAFADAKGW